MRKIGILSLLFLVGLVVSLSASAGPLSLLTPTPTPDKIELVRNGGFESAGFNQRAAVHWRIESKTRGTQRVQYAVHKGAYALRVKQATVRQEVFVPVGFPGNTLTFSGWTKTVLLQNDAEIRVDVTYEDESQETLSVTIPAGTQRYRAFSDSLLLKADPARIVLSIVSPGWGRLFVDDLSLIFEVQEEATPTEAPYSDPSAEMSADKISVKVGEIITLRVKLSDLGIPMYTLNLSSGAIGRVDANNQIQGTLGKDAVFEIIDASADPFNATFVLKAVGVGSSDAYAYISGEAFMPEPLPGAWYWTGVTSNTLHLEVVESE